MKEYGYVQSKKHLSNFVCDSCGNFTAEGQVVEWRVDMFQGNCEYTKECSECLGTKMSILKREHEKAQREQQLRDDKHDAKLSRLENLLTSKGITVKKYPATGQWVLNNIVDWWTTTGTAINRKTREQYHFSVKNPEKIIKILTTLT
jgi:hypothetical protein